MPEISNSYNQLDSVRLSECFSYLDPKEQASCREVNKTWQIVSERTPVPIKDGHFRSKLRHKDGPIYIHMELLTEENHKGWEIYKLWTRSINSDLTSIIKNIIEETKNTYDEKTKKILGFSDEEYNLFTREIIELKKKKPNIVKVISGISSGIMALNTNPRPGPNYIVYASTDSNATLLPNVQCRPNYKEFTELYKNIIMSVGVDFGYTEDLHNDGKILELNHFYEDRGISVNYFWELKNKFKGISPSLHAATGIITELYFSQKKWMVCRPLSSMLAIFIKILKRGDGYTWEKVENEIYSEKKDITDCKVSPSDRGEHSAYYIKASSLARIHFQ